MKKNTKESITIFLFLSLFIVSLSGANACERCVSREAYVDEIKELMSNSRALSQKELEKLMNEAASGNMMSLRTLAMRYSSGTGVEKDEIKGRKFFKKMAELGDPGAMRVLAAYCIRGEAGLSVDLQKGINWYTQAAEAGDFKSARRLCQLYMKGLNGVAVDQQKAVECALLAEKAALDKGCAADFLTLATLYESGVGFPKNVEKSVVFYKAAAEKGIIGAMLKLSMMFYEGAQVDADPVEGKMWMGRATMTLQAEGVNLGAPHQHTADCRH